VSPFWGRKLFPTLLKNSKLRLGDGRFTSINSLQLQFSKVEVAAHPAQLRGARPCAPLFILLYKKSRQQWRVFIF